MCIYIFMIFRPQQYANDLILLLLLSFWLWGLIHQGTFVMQGTKCLLCIIFSVSFSVPEDKRSENKGMYLPMTF